MPKRFDEGLLRDALMGVEEAEGLFERALGFGTATGVIKGVHVMNDLAQSALGGAPDHKGELLSRVIREDRTEKGEDNSDAAMRAWPRLGAAYARAFPESVHPADRSRLRAAIGEVFNFDGGVYRAGDGMASGLATHWTLLGAEGFRRFRVGRYLCRIIGEPGQARLVALLRDAEDPISRLLAPLLLEAPLADRAQVATEPVALSPFDVAAGARLAGLLAHPLSKPTLLRDLLLGATLMIALKVLGAGRPEGRPAALATVALDGDEGRLRQEAVQSFRWGVDALDRLLARLLLQHPAADALWTSRPAKGAAAIELADDVRRMEDAAPLLIQAARAQKWSGKDVYWPEDFIISLGRKAGCVLPRRDNAGWGKRLALTPDLIEVLVLMYVPPDAPPRPWREVWADIRAELGLVIGANELQDATLLEEVGVSLVSLEAMERNSEAALELAVRRGVGRRLPDSGAEAGGALQ